MIINRHLNKCLKTLIFFPLFSGDDDEEESGEERLPSCFDYIMHFLTVFWKVLFAFVPPTEYWNGWACFFVSISLIGILTAVTGDLASHFGCTIGLKDSVTAVVFVALGTSVPGGCVFAVCPCAASLGFVSVKAAACCLIVFPFHCVLNTATVRRGKYANKTGIQSVWKVTHAFS